MQRIDRRLGVLTLTIGLILSACAATGGSSPSAPPSDQPPDAPVSSPPDDGVVPPDPGGARLVIPKPGQLDVHPVTAEAITATVDGRHVTLDITWWSGVEPCSILDTVVVETGPQSFAVTLREGRGPEEIACIAIAEQHRTVVDLGELAPGTYTVTDATGGAPAIEVVVS